MKLKFTCRRKNPIVLTKKEFLWVSTHFSLLYLIYKENEIQEVEFIQFLR